MLIDAIFGGVLLLNLTGMFGFVGVTLGVPISVVSGVLLMANLGYLLYRLPAVVRCIRHPTFSRWLILIGLWPLLTVLYAPLWDTRSLALQVYYISLMLGAAVWVRVVGWAAFRRLIGLAVGITVFGLVLSYLQPSVFAAAASLAETHESYHDRAFGFFLQPNVAAESMLFLAILWFAGRRGEPRIHMVLRVVVILLSVVMTGSRGGLAVTLLVVFYMTLSGAYREKTGGLRPTRGVRVLKVGFATIGTIGLLGAAGYLGASAVKGTPFEAGANRVAALSTVGESGGVLADGSAAQRLIGFQQHFTMYRQRPLHGYGIGSSGYYRGSGRIWVASHNQYLESAFSYGIFYVLVYLAALLALYRHPSRQLLEPALSVDVVVLLVVGVLLAGLVSNTILESRVLMASLGAVLAALAFPDLVLGHKPRVATSAATAPRSHLGESVS